MKQACGIYKLAHIESGKIYVGQSVDIHQRLESHRHRKNKTHISCAIHKYGWRAFSAEILEICERADLNEKESYWVNLLPCISPLGFNLRTGGQQAFEVSQEARQKLSAALKGVPKSKSHAANVGAALKGKKQRSEVVAARAANQRGKKYPDRKPAYALRGVPLDAEHRAKIASALTGKKLSPETIRRRSASRYCKVSAAQQDFAF